MKRNLQLGMICLSVFSFIFVQNGFAQKESVEGDTPNATPHSGIQFNLPSGNWLPIPIEKSLFPATYNRLQEDLEQDKKVTVLFRTTNAASHLLDVQDQVIDDLAPYWKNILVTEKLHPIPSLNPGEVDHWEGVYSLEDPMTKVSFRLELSVVTGPRGEGNRGIIYILTPTEKYYENRYFISEIKKSLSWSSPSESKEEPVNN